jgi:hypothetical protein
VSEKEVVFRGTSLEILVEVGIFRFTFEEKNFHCILNGNGIDFAKCVFGLFNGILKVFSRCVVDGM